MTRRIKRILVIVDLGTIPGRNHFMGLLDYARTKSDWLLLVAEPGEKFDLHKLHEIQRDGLDGIIMTLPCAGNVMRTLSKGDLPTIFANIPNLRLSDNRRNVSFVYTDNDAIGRMAARHFLSVRTFKSFAFLDAPNQIFWAQECKRAFRDAICGHTPFTDLNPEALEDDIRSLPLPTAVMTAYYSDAERIAAICRKLKLSISLQVAILCLNSESGEFNRNNTITSIESDMHGLGYHEGAELDRIMKRAQTKSVKAREIVLPPVGIVTRESTAPSNHALLLVQQIDTFIAENFRDDISVEDITNGLGCSRRLAEIRYREIKSCSIRKALENVRLAAAIDLLKASTSPTTEIASLCGFSSSAQLARVFAKQTKQSIRTWCVRRSKKPKTT